LHTFVCGENPNLKTKLEFKTTSFEYSKKCMTLKIYNMKKVITSKNNGTTSKKHQQEYF
jgi:hypothetical protein